jgi:ureidoglycolate lyase
MTALTEQRLSLEVATATSFAPFGALVAADTRAGRGTSFYDDAVRLWDIPGMVTDADACVAVARIRKRPGIVRWMERHFLHTQIFMPLNGEPFAMVLAPPNDGNAPDPRTIRAFRFDGRQGVMLAVGTWHEFPFALAGDADIAVFLRSETNANLDVVEDGEAVGGDLEKRDIARRLGVRYILDGVDT